MAIEVFNRYEKKYRLCGDGYRALQAALSAHMTPDAYLRTHDHYTIANLYYDTPCHHLIRTSIEKPPYKEKLRLRSYGVPDDDSTVYLEIKKKVKGLVNKRRSGMTLREAEQLLAGGAPPAIRKGVNGQVLDEIDYLLSQFALAPAMMLAYDRKAYFGAEDKHLRISFDTNITYRTTELDLRQGLHGTQLLGPDEWLMEIKAPHSMPLWLTHLLDELKVYPAGFSKYGRAYQRELTVALSADPNTLQTITA